MLLPTAEARDFQAWGSLAVIQILYTLLTHLDPAGQSGSEETVKLARLSGLHVREFYHSFQLSYLLRLHETKQQVRLTLSPFSTANRAGWLRGLSEMKQLKSSAIKVLSIKIGFSYRPI